MNYTCLYCKQWMNSRIVKTIVSGKAAKFSRYCIEHDKDINSNSQPCHHFKPANHFLCLKLNCRKHLKACLYGHAYSKHGSYPVLYSECSKCKQYEQTIKPICQKYNINYGKQVAELPRRKKQYDSKLNEKGYESILPKRRNKKITKLPKRRKENKIAKLPKRR